MIPSYDRVDIGRMGAYSFFLIKKVPEVYPEVSLSGRMHFVASHFTEKGIFREMDD